MPNRLAAESSPYLRQHAHNPVDWYAWGEAAFAKARAEDKPILLSVGYSACHWCHVMAHECFESAAVARMMNEGFVNIKVDREERPDVDEVYQRVTQMVSGQGGWPLTVFLDPQLRPLYGGTYFPPDDRYGRPGFPRVLTAVLDAYRNRRAQAETSAAEFVQRMRMFDTGEAGSPPARDALAAAEEQLRRNFDSTHGGFGTAPKFPMAADLEALLARFRATGGEEALGMVLFTLQKMAAGGIYDQLGGGFHRYSVDPYWLVPHFEKMLYDNALVPRVFLEAFRLTGDPLYARVVHETLGYLLREMQGPEGGFYSAQDADSEGVEGKFFVWTPAELEAALGKERARLFAAVYDVTPAGNWEGHTILRVVRDTTEAAQELGLTADEAQRRLNEDRQKLLAIRERRVKPGLDDKRITAWNGLVLTAFARAGALFEHPAYLDTARRLAEFLTATMWDAGARRLRRIYHAGGPKIDGFLDDYAYTAAGLLDLHRATGEDRWAEKALPLLEGILARFRGDDGTLYLTPGDAEALPARPRSAYDQMLPSPAGVALQALWRAYVLTGDTRFKESVETGLGAYGPEIARHPTAFGGLLAAVDLYYRGENTCVVAGDASNPAARRLAETARRFMAADDAVLYTQPAGIAKRLTEDKRTPDGSPAAFVCEGFACAPPARSPEELKRLLVRES